MNLAADRTDSLSAAALTLRKFLYTLITSSILMIYKKTIKDLLTLQENLFFFRRSVCWNKGKWRLIYKDIYNLSIYLSIYLRNNNKNNNNKLLNLLTFFTKFTNFFFVFFHHWGVPHE